MDAETQKSSTSRPTSGNLVDMVTISDAVAALRSGPLILPGGGTISLNRFGVKIAGPVDIIELERISNGRDGFFNLSGISKFRNQNTEGINIATIGTEGSTFGLELKRIDESKHPFPMLKDAALTLFSIQFLPEFQRVYLEYGRVEVRLGKDAEGVVDAKLGARYTNSDLDPQNPVMKSLGAVAVYGQSEEYRKADIEIEESDRTYHFPREAVIRFSDTVRLRMC